MKYYLITGNKSFQIILSDGDYEREKEDDRYIHLGKVYGTFGGWEGSSNKFITPKMYDKPRFEYMFDPTKYEYEKKELTKESTLRETIQFIFEKFRP